MYVHRAWLAYLAISELLEDIVGHEQGNVRLWFRGSLGDFASLLQVQSPDGLLLLSVADSELDDTVGLDVAVSAYSAGTGWLSRTHLLDL